VIKLHRLWTFKTGSALDSRLLLMEFVLYFNGLDTSVTELKVSLHCV